MSDTTQTVKINVEGLAEIKALAEALRGVAPAADKTTQSTEDTSQAMANLVDGVQQVTVMVQGLNKAFNGLHTASSKAFIEAQNAMTDVQIVIGRTGNFLLDQNSIAFNKLSKDVKDDIRAMDAEYSGIEKKISQLARSTEFSYTQIAMLFKQFKQSGLGVDTIIKPIKDGTAPILDAALAFTSASRGALSLSEAGKMLVLSANSLGGGLSEVSTNADRMLRTINSADVSFEDLKIMMESLSGVGELEFKSGGPKVMLGFLAALKTAGRPAAIAANDMLAMSRALKNLLASMEVAKARADPNSWFNADRGKATKRKTVKEFALRRLGIATEDFLGQDGEFKTLSKLVGFLRKVRDAAKDKSKLSDVAAIIGKDLLPDETNQKKLIEKGMAALSKRKGMESGGMSSAVVEAMIYKALGTQQAVGVMKSIDILEKRLKDTGVNQASFEKFMDDIEATQDDSANAQKLVLSTVKGQTDLLDAATFSLNERIGKVTAAYEMFSIQTLRYFITGLDDSLRSSNGLTSALGSLIVVGKEFTGALAFTGGSLGIVVALQQITKGLTAVFGVGEGGVLTMSAVGTTLKTMLTSLAPILKFVGVLGGSIALLTVLISLIQNMDTSGLSAPFQVIVGLFNDFKDAMSIIVGVVLPSFFTKIDETTANRLSQMSTGVQTLALVLNELGSFVSFVFENIFVGLAKGFGAVLGAVILPFVVVFNALVEVLGHLYRAYTVVSGAFSDSKDDINAVSGAIGTLGDYLASGLLQALGALGGILFANFVITKAYNAAIIIYTGVTKTAAAAAKLLGTREIIATKARAIYTTVTNGLAGAQRALAFSSGVLSLSTFGYAIVIGLVLGALYLLFVGFQYLYDVMGRNKIAAIFLTAITAILAITAFILAKGLFASAIAGTALSTGLAPVLIVIIAIIAVVGALIYGIYRLAKYFGFMGDSAQGAADSLGNLTSAKDQALASVELPSAVKALKKPSASAVPGGEDIQELLGGSTTLDMSSLQQGVEMPDMSSLVTSSPTTSAPKEVKLSVSVNDTTGMASFDPQAGRRIARALVPHLEDFFVPRREQNV